MGKVKGRYMNTNGLRALAIDETNNAIEGVVGVSGLNWREQINQSRTRMMVRMRVRVRVRRG